MKRQPLPRPYFGSSPLGLSRYTLLVLLVVMCAGRWTTVSAASGSNFDCVYANSTCSSPACPSVCSGQQFYELLPKTCSPEGTALQYGEPRTNSTVPSVLFNGNAFPVPTELLPPSDVLHARFSASLWFKGEGTIFTLGSMEEAIEVSIEKSGMQSHLVVALGSVTLLNRTLTNELEWNYFAMTLEQVGANVSSQVFLGGMQLDTASTTVYDLSNFILTMQIGSGFVGSLQDVGIFSGVLTASDVEQLALGVGSLSGAAFLPNCLCPLDYEVDATDEQYCVSTDQEGTTQARYNEGSHAVEFLVDGDNSTYWRSGDGEKVATILLQLSHPTSLSKIFLTFESPQPLLTTIQYLPENDTSWRDLAYFASDCTGVAADSSDGPYTASCQTSMFSGSVLAFLLGSAISMPWSGSMPIDEYFLATQVVVRLDSFSTSIQYFAIREITICSTFLLDTALTCSSVPILPSSVSEIFSSTLQQATETTDEIKSSTYSDSSSSAESISPTLSVEATSETGKKATTSVSQTAEEVLLDSTAAPTSLSLLDTFPTSSTDVEASSSFSVPSSSVSAVTAESSSSSTMKMTSSSSVAAEVSTSFTSTTVAAANTVVSSSFISPTMTSSDGVGTSKDETTPTSSATSTGVLSSSITSTTSSVVGPLSTRFEANPTSSKAAISTTVTIGEELTSTIKITPTSSSTVEAPTSSSTVVAPTSSSTVEAPTSSSTVVASTSSSTVVAPTSSSTVEAPTSSSTEETPTSSSTVEAPTSSSTATSSSTVVAPTSSSMAEAPTSSSTVETPTSSSTEETPTSSSTVVAPTSSSMAEAPTSSSTVETPTSSSTVEAPTSSSTEETPTSSSTVEAPTSSSTVEAPTSSSTEETPTSSSTVVAPTSSSMAEAPTSSSTVETPTSSSTVEAPTSSSTVEAPTSSSMVETPTSSSTVEVPTSSSRVEGPTSSLMVEAPTSSSTAEAPTSSSIIEGPTSSTRVEGPTSSSMVEAPTSSSTVVAPTSSSTAEMPTSSSMLQASTSSSFVEVLPTSSSTVEAPTSSSTVEAPTSSSTVETPTSPSMAEVLPSPSTVEAPTSSSTVEAPTSSSSIEAPTSSSTVETPTSSSTVEAPTSSSTVEAPTSSSTVEAPTSSSTVETPTSSSTVEAPASSSTVEAPTSSSTVEAPTSSSTVETPTSSSTVEAPTSSSTVEAPASSSTVEAPTSSSTVEAPTSSSTVEAPTSSSTVEAPTSSSTVEAPTSSSTVETPTSSSTVEAPTSSSTVEAPTSSSTVEAPTSSSTVETPTSSLMAEALPSPSTVETPTSSSTVEAPTSSSTVETPTSSSTVEAPTSSSTVEAPTSSSTEETPTSSSTVETPTSSSTVEAPTSSSMVEVLPSSSEVEVVLQTSSSTVTPTSSLVQSSSSRMEAPTSSSTVVAPTNSSMLQASTSSSFVEVLPTSSSTVEAPTSSSTVEAPTSSSTVEAPTSSSTVEAPTSSSTVEAPTSSSTVVAPTSSSTVETPTSSSTVEAPTSSSMAEALPNPSTVEVVVQTSSPTTEATTSSSIVETPASFPTIKLPAISSTAEALPSSSSTVDIVVQTSSPTIEETTSSSMVETPTSSSTGITMSSSMAKAISSTGETSATSTLRVTPTSMVVALTSSSTVEAPTSSSKVEEPISSSVLQTPSISSLAEVLPTSSSMLVVETSSSSIEAPTSSSTVEAPTSSSTVVAPASSSTVEAPTSSSMVLVQTNSSIIEIPTSSSMVVVQTSSSTVVAPTSSSTVEAPTSSSMVVVQTNSSIIEMPTSSSMVVVQTSSSMIETPTSSSILEQQASSPMAEASTSSSVGAISSIGVAPNTSSVVKLASISSTSAVSAIVVPTTSGVEEPAISSTLATGEAPTIATTVAISSTLTMGEVANSSSLVEASALATEVAPSISSTGETSSGGVLLTIPPTPETAFIGISSTATSQTIPLVPTSFPTSSVSSSVTEEAFPSVFPTISSTNESFSTSFEVIPTSFVVQPTAASSFATTSNSIVLTSTNVVEETAIPTSSETIFFSESSFLVTQTSPSISLESSLAPDMNSIVSSSVFIETTEVSSLTFQPTSPSSFTPDNSSTVMPMTTNTTGPILTSVTSVTSVANSTTQQLQSTTQPSPLQPEMTATLQFSSTSEAFNFMTEVVVASSTTQIIPSSVSSATATGSQVLPSLLISSASVSTEIGIETNSTTSLSLPSSPTSESLFPTSSQNATSSVPLVTPDSRTEQLQITPTLTLSTTFEVSSSEEVSQTLSQPELTASLLSSVSSVLNFTASQTEAPVTNSTTQQLPFQTSVVPTITEVSISPTPVLSQVSALFSTEGDVGSGQETTSLKPELTTEFSAPMSTNLTFEFSQTVTSVIELNRTQEIPNILSSPVFSASFSTDVEVESSVPITTNSTAVFELNRTQETLTISPTPVFSASFSTELEVESSSPIVTNSSTDLEVNRTQEVLTISPTPVFNTSFSTEVEVESSAPIATNSSTVLEVNRTQETLTISPTPVLNTSFSMEVEVESSAITTNSSAVLEVNRTQETLTISPTPVFNTSFSTEVEVESSAPIVTNSSTVLEVNRTQETLTISPTPVLNTSFSMEVEVESSAITTNSSAVLEVNRTQETLTISPTPVLNTSFSMEVEVESSAITTNSSAVLEVNRTQETLTISPTPVFNTSFSMEVEVESSAITTNSSAVLEVNRTQETLTISPTPVFNTSFSMEVEVESSAITTNSSAVLEVNRTQETLTISPTPVLNTSFSTEVEVESSAPNSTLALIPTATVSTELNGTQEIPTISSTPVFSVSFESSAPITTNSTAVFEVNRTQEIPSLSQTPVFSASFSTEVDVGSGLDTSQIEVTATVAVSSTAPSILLITPSITPAPASFFFSTSTEQSAASALPSFSELSSFPSSSEVDLGSGFDTMSIIPGLSTGFFAATSITASEVPSASATISEITPSRISITPTMDFFPTTSGEAGSGFEPSTQVLLVTTSLIELNETATTSTQFQTESLVSLLVNSSTILMTTAAVSETPNISSATVTSIATSAPQISTSVETSVFFSPTPTPQPLNCSVYNQEVLCERFDACIPLDQPCPINPYAPIEIEVTGLGFVLNTPLEGVSENGLNYSIPIGTLISENVNQDSGIVVATLGSREFVSKRFYKPLLPRESIHGFVVETELWPDNPWLHVTVQASDVAFRTQVEPFTANILIVHQSAEQLPQNLSCDIPSASYGMNSGACSVEIEVQSQWFQTGGNITISVENAVLGEVVLYPVKLNRTIPNSVYMDLPQKIFFPGDEITIPVFSKFEYLLSSFTLDCATNSDTVTIAPLANTNWSLVMDEFENRMALAGFRVRDTFSTTFNPQEDLLVNLNILVGPETAPETDVVIRCEVKELFMTTREQIPLFEQTIVNSIDRLGRVTNSATIPIVSRRIVDLLVYTEENEFVNTAVLTGKGNVVARPSVQHIWNDGSTTNASTNDIDFTCSSLNTAVINVPGNCSFLYFDGSESNGSEETKVMVEVSNIQVNISFKVWIPDISTLEIIIEDSTLNSIYNAPDPLRDCSPMFQKSKADIYVTIRAGSEFHMIKVSAILRSQLRSTNASVARITNEWEVEGVSEGKVFVYLENFRSLTETEVTVVSTAVKVVDLEIFAFSGILIGTANLNTTSIQLVQEFQYEDNPVHVSVFALFDDSHRMEVHNGTELDVGVTESIHYNNTRLITVSAEWNSHSMCGSVTTFENTLNLLPQLQQPRFINITLHGHEAVISPPQDPASTSVNIPTSLEFSVTLTYPQGRVRTNVTSKNEPKLMTYSSNSNLTVSAEEGYYIVTVAEEATAGVAEIQVSYDNLILAAFHMEIVKVESLSVLARPYPTFNRSQSMELIALNPIGNGGMCCIQKAKLEVVVHLSNGSVAVAQSPLLKVMEPNSGAQIDDDNVLMVNLSSIGHVVTIKGEIGNLSNEMQIEISSEPIEVLEIIDLIFPSSFVEEVNGSMKADASVILTDETRLPSTFDPETGAAMYGNLIQFGSGNSNILSVEQGTSRVSLLSSYHHFVDLYATATANQSVVFHRAVSCNLRPRAGEVGLGQTSGIPVPPVQPQEQFELPLYANSQVYRVGVYEVELNYDPELMEFISANQGENWLNGSLVFHQTQKNQVLLGGVLNSGVQASTIRLVDLAFRAKTSGIASFNTTVRYLSEANLGLFTINDGDTPLSGQVDVLVQNQSSAINRRGLVADAFAGSRKTREAILCDNTLPGDLNRDCLLDLRDVYLLQVYLAAQVHNFSSPNGALLSNVTSAVDSDGDGIVTAADIFATEKFAFNLAYIISELTNSTSLQNSVCIFELSGSLETPSGDPAPADSVFVFVDFSSTNSSFQNTFNNANFTLGEVIGYRSHSEVYGGTVQAQVNSTEDRGTLFSIRAENLVGFEPNFGVSLIQVTADAYGMVVESGVLVYFGQTITQLSSPVDIPLVVNEDTVSIVINNHAPYLNIVQACTVVVPSLSTPITSSTPLFESESTVLIASSQPSLSSTSETSSLSSVSGFVTPTNTEAVSSLVLQTSVAASTSVSSAAVSTVFIAPSTVTGTTSSLIDTMVSISPSSTAVEEFVSSASVERETFMLTETSSATTTLIPSTTTLIPSTTEEPSTSLLMTTQGTTLIGFSSSVDVSPSLAISPSSSTTAAELSTSIAVEPSSSEPTPSMTTGLTASTEAATSISPSSSTTAAELSTSTAVEPSPSEPSPSMTTGLTASTEMTTSTATSLSTQDLVASSVVASSHSSPVIAVPSTSVVARSSTSTEAVLPSTSVTASSSAAQGLVSSTPVAISDALPSTSVARGPITSTVVEESLSPTSVLTTATQSLVSSTSVAISPSSSTSDAALLSTSVARGPITSTVVEEPTSVLTTATQSLVSSTAVATALSSSASVDAAVTYTSMAARSTTSTVVEEPSSPTLVLTTTATQALVSSSTVAVTSSSSEPFTSVATEFAEASSSTSIVTPSSTQGITSSSASAVSSSFSTQVITEPSSSVDAPTTSTSISPSPRAVSSSSVASSYSTPGLRTSSSMTAGPTTSTAVDDVSSTSIATPSKVLEPSETSSYSIAGDTVTSTSSMTSTSTAQKGVPSRSSSPVVSSSARVKSSPSMAATSTGVPPKVTSSATQDTPTTSASDSNETLIIIGVGLMGAVIVILLTVICIVICCCVVKRWKKKKGRYVPSMALRPSSRVSKDYWFGEEEKVEMSPIDIVPMEPQGYEAETIFAANGHVYPPSDPNSQYVSNSSLNPLLKQQQQQRRGPGIVPKQPYTRPEFQHMPPESSVLTNGRTKIPIDEDEDELIDLMFEEEGPSQPHYLSLGLTPLSQISLPEADIGFFPSMPPPVASTMMNPESEISVDDPTSYQDETLYPQHVASGLEHRRIGRRTKSDFAALSQGYPAARRLETVPEQSPHGSLSRESDLSASERAVGVFPSALSSEVSQTESTPGKRAKATLPYERSWSHRDVITNRDTGERNILLTEKPSPRKELRRKHIEARERELAKETELRRQKLLEEDRRRREGKKYPNWNYARTEVTTTSEGREQNDPRNNSGQTKDPFFPKSDTQLTAL